MSETLGSIYEDISAQLSESRHLAMQGKIQEALAEYHSANKEFVRFRESLKGYPGFEALEYALTYTYRALIGNMTVL